MKSSNLPVLIGVTYESRNKWKGATFGEATHKELIDMYRQTGSCRYCQPRLVSLYKGPVVE